MISVIIPTYNRAGPLHRALRSLARQTFTDFDVIVVNDGGDPVEQVTDRWHNHLPITLIEDDQRRGVSCARNRGMATARGEYVAFLDDDDIVLPQHLHLAHQALDAGIADAVYGGALVSSRWLEARPRDAHRLPRKDYPFDPRFLHVANYIHTGSVVCRTFSGAGARFDETLTHCEDWAMWLTLYETLRYRFAYLGEVTSVYHQLPHTDGTVSQAYRTSPTPFTLARAHLFDTWPAADPHIRDYRAWFTTFDTRLDTRIEQGHPAPAHIYELAVRAAYRGFVHGEPADHRLLDVLIPQPDSLRDRHPPEIG